MKTLYTLNVDNFAPKIRDITYPFFKRYADKIGAEFVEITKRKFPGFPPVYEKLQIHELGKKSDWNIFIDADTLIHPDTPDITTLYDKDTVGNYNTDFASIRWTYDKYFLRDNRHISSCGWLTIASNWCLDLWKPLDMPLDEAVKNIHPTSAERAKGMENSHLIDDYVMSRNIARFGLKYARIKDKIHKHLPGAKCFIHTYLLSTEEKVKWLGQNARAMK